MISLPTGRAFGLLLVVTGLRHSRGSARWAQTVLEQWIYELK
jgi:hypothetical protein